MKTINHTFSNKDNLIKFVQENNLPKNCFVQIFSGVIDESPILEIINTLKKHLTSPIINGVTTAGELIDGKVQEYSIVLSFSCFEKTKIESIYYDINQENNKYDSIIDNIVKHDTKLVLFFADGFKKSTKVEYFLKRFYEKYPHIMIGGGRAGDNLEFKTSLIFNNDVIKDNGLLITAFSGDDLIVNNGFNFDWIPIGREFTITKSKDNIVYEIDNMPIIEFYKKYLGELIADELPGIGLEFPLIIQRDGINIARGAMQKLDDGGLLLTGKVISGEKVKLGFGNKANILNAAQNNYNSFLDYPIESIFVYSCAARKLFLGNDIETEIDNLSNLVPISGFCSYSEFYHNKKDIELLSYTTTYICLSEKTITSHKKNHFKTKPVDDKIMYALSNFITTTSNELIDINNNLENKVEEKVNTINTQRNSYLSYYKQIVDNMTESIIMLDKNNTFMSINKKGIETIGYTLENLQNRTICDILTKNTSKDFKKFNKNTIKGDRIKHIGEIITKDNKIIPVKISYIPYTEGGTVLILQNLDEIKELKKLNHELLNKSTILHEYKKALDLTSYVIRMNKDKEIQYVNQQVIDFFGAEKSHKSFGKLYDEMLLKNGVIYKDKLLKEKLSITNIYKQTQETKLPYECIVREKNKFDELHWFQNYLIPIVDIGGNIVEYISTSIDITQFIKYEQHLKESYEKLKELNSKKTNFLNIASHELRTPLTSINGYLSMILDGDFGEINPQVEKYLKIVSGSLSHLLQLISDMLDVSRIEGAKQECVITKVDLQNLINNIFLELTPLASNKNITFTNNFSTDEINISICEKNLRKILINLIGNALKYTPNGGEVKINTIFKNNSYIICKKQANL